MLSTTYLRTLLQTIPDLVWLKDPTGVYMACNAAFERFSGLQEAEVIGKTDYDLVAPVLAEAFRAGDRAAIASGRVSYEEEWLTFAVDGYHGLFQATKTPMYDAEGRLIGVLGIARDITAAYHYREALRESESRYRNLFETMVHGVVYQDLDGRIIDANPAAARILGLSLDQLMGRTSIDRRWYAIHEDGSPFPGETHPSMVALHTGQAVHDVVMGVYNPATENYTWITINALPQIRPGERAPSYVYTTFEDITRRREAELALREHAAELQQAHSDLDRYRRRLEDRVAERTAELEESNHQLEQIAERLRLATSSAGIGVWEHIIPDDRLIWDERMFALYGICAEDFSGHAHDWFSYVHPDDRELAYKEGLKSRQGKRDYAAEFRIIWPDGSTHHIAASAKLECDPDGKPLRAVGVNWDITARKRDEQELERQRNHLEQLVAELEATNRQLRESEERYRVLFGSLADALLVTDVENFQFIDCNDAAARLFGAASREQLFSMTLEQITPAYLPDGRSAIVLANEYIMRAFTEGSSVFEWMLHKYDGTPFPALISLSVIQFQDRSQLLAIVRDISEIKRYQIELECARDAAEAANLAKSAFLATMSHELRTPLNAILGRSELLREQLYGPLTEKQRSAIASIEEGGAHLLELINDVLDLSKIEAGKIELSFEPVVIESLCQAALRMVKQNATVKRIALTSTSDNLVNVIEADGRRLKQILVNLLANAVKFTPDGGEVGLEVKGDPERQSVTFTVRDTGIGIAAEDLPRLFKPFVQIDNRLSRQYSGTGLGLALVLHLTELHGGSVAVESTLAIGSRFSVTLPWRLPMTAAELPAPVVQPARAIPSSGAAGPLVLVAEDNPAGAQLLIDYLPLAGYQVAHASNGVEALARARELHPAIILMDIQMPTMDGLEAIRHIRATPALHHIPIIALTALAMPGDREHCLEAGADEYLAKPVRMRLLLDAITTQLERSN